MKFFIIALLYLPVLLQGCSTTGNHLDAPNEVLQIVAVTSQVDKLDGMRKVLNSAQIKYDLDIHMGQRYIEVRPRDYMRASSLITAQFREDIKSGGVLTGEAFYRELLDNSIALSETQAAKDDMLDGYFLKALVRLNHACTLKWEYSEAIFTRALVRERLGDFEGASVDLKRVISIGRLRVAEAEELLMRLESR